MQYRPTEFHHGDCIGADAQAHQIATALRVWRVVHPPEDANKRALCFGDRYMPAKPYLVRNREIVDVSDLLIAAIKEDAEELRSGTWSTIRYARKTRKPVLIISPSGRMHMEGR